MHASFSPSSLSIAVLGATGNVGRMVVTLLLEKGFPRERIALFASARSRGHEMSIDGATFHVNSPEDPGWHDHSIYALATDEEVSRLYVPELLKRGKWVLDSSPEYRMTESVPLVVPPVNGHLVQSHPIPQLIALANCVAAPLSMALAPLMPWGIEHVHASSYQSASGAGKAAMDELMDHTQTVHNTTSLCSQSFPRSLALNVIPQIGRILPCGKTSEESKVIAETQRILQGEFPLFVTCVRVAVRIGHCIAVWIDLRQDASREDICKAINAHSHVMTLHESDLYTTPREIENSDMISIGRFHMPSPRKVHFWVCSDNLRRGAATDLVESTLMLHSQLVASPCASCSS